jgi:hypothetical protein
MAPSLLRDDGPLAEVAPMVTGIGRWSMIPKSGYRFSDKIMLKQ